MDDVASETAHWSLHNTIGRLSCGELSGEVDVVRPALMLHGNEYSDRKSPNALLGVTRSVESSTIEDAQSAIASVVWPLPLADVYVRGNDLVASYRPLDYWPYSPQLYWQANTLHLVEGVLGSLSLTVSLQTHLLDTCPQISVASQMPSDELLCISITDDGIANLEPVEQSESVTPKGTMLCVICRRKGAPMSYAEIMPTTDFRELKLHAEGERRGNSWTEWRLFADFLEKGVIRKARVQAALLPRHNDVELAIECCRALAESPLPLTT